MGAPAPECFITRLGHCHLRGIRYNAKPCADVCDLAPEAE